MSADSNARTTDGHEYEFLSEPRIITSWRFRPSKLPSRLVKDLPPLGLNEQFCDGRTFTLWPKHAGEPDGDVEPKDSENRGPPGGEMDVDVYDASTEQSRGDGEEMEKRRSYSEFRYSRTGS